MGLGDVYRFGFFIGWERSIPWIHFMISRGRPVMLEYDDDGVGME